MIWFPLCRIIAPTRRKKMWKNFYNFWVSRSKCFGACSIIFLSPQSVVIVSSLHYNHIIKKAPDGQLTQASALGLGTKNMLNFLINLFTSRNGFLSMSFKSTSSSIFLHPKYYLHVVLKYIHSFIRLSKCALYPKQILFFTISLLE